MTTPAYRVLPSPAERRLADRLASIDGDITALYEQLRTAQLGSTTIMGTMPIRDANGVLTGIVGVQDDGTTGLTYQNASPPPRPNTPDLAPINSGIVVSWNGTFSTADRPANFKNVEVYLSGTANFIPGPTNFQGTLPDSGSIPVAPLDTSAPYYAVLIATNAAEPAANTGTGTRSTSTTSLQGGPATPSQVVGQDILDGAISTLKIADGAVATAKVAVNAIDVTKIAANAVTATQLAANAVTTAKLAAGAVTTTQIADGSISTPKIIAGAVQSTSLATDSVSAGKIAADAVTAREVAATSIGATELAAGSVIAGKIATGAVQAGTIAVDAVSAGTIAADAVTSREILALAVNTAELAANSVTAGQIAAGSVTASKLQADLVVASRVIAGTLTGARVELHPTAGLQGFDGSGNRTLWLNSATGDFLAIGSVQTALTGTRIVMNPGGNNPDTVRFYPSTGSQYASIDSIVSSGNYAGIMMYGASSGTLRGICIAREDYASLIYADPTNLFATIKTDIFVSSGASSTAGRIRGYQFDMMADVDQGSDPGFRFMVTHGTSMISDTLLYYNNSRSGGSGHDEAHFAAVNNNIGITFADIAGSGLNERLWIVGNNVTQRKDLGVWSVVYDGVVVSSSSQTIKRNIVPAQDLDPRQAVRAAKACYFQKNIGDEGPVYYSDGTLKRGPREAPTQFGLIAEDVPEVVQHNIGPILPGEPESLGISLDGLVTLLWQGQSDVHDRIDKAVNGPKWIPEPATPPPPPTTGATLYVDAGSVYALFASGKRAKIA